jgi:hypothetical protein
MTDTSSRRVSSVPCKAHMFRLRRETFVHEVGYLQRLISMYKCSSRVVLSFLFLVNPAVRMVIERLSASSYLARSPVRLLGDRLPSKTLRRTHARPKYALRSGLSRARQADTDPHAAIKVFPLKIDRHSPLFCITPHLGAPTWKSPPETMSDCFTELRFRFERWLLSLG